MQAIVDTEYGPPGGARAREIDMPALDADGVLVRVRAASVNPLDWHVMRGEPYLVRLTGGLRRPKRAFRGVDVAGQVEAVGENVTPFDPATRCSARAGCLRRVRVRRPRGTRAEAGRPHVRAGGGRARRGGHRAAGLRDRGQVQPGQTVLVNGAAGGVGTFAVQIAKAFGADVTGVCSTRNVELVRSLGADHVIDYTAEDFSRAGRRYDLIVDTVGNHSLSQFRRVLAPNGTLVSSAASRTSAIGFAARASGWIAVVSPFVGQTIVPLLAKHGREGMLVLTELIESGKVTPVIDRTYPLDEAPDAIRYLEAGHAQGKVMITV